MQHKQLLQLQSLHGCKPRTPRPDGSVRASAVFVGTPAAAVVLAGLIIVCIMVLVNIAAAAVVAVAVCV